MRIQFTIVLLCLCLSFSAFAQDGLIRGTIRDTSENKSLSNAVVAVLRQTDSTLVSFVRSGEQGHFEIKHIAPGKYQLLISYPKFAGFVEEVTVESGKPVDMGLVALTPQSALLAEVIVRQNIAIRMKGDTIEYKADSFKVDQGANVQELLKQLPGIQVDRNGQIIAQGQKVEKVLVDGEEFFSDDPAVVTQNLRADAIDKIQSYDKKSDQAEFTGVDDGSRSKTLNLVLKDDKKKGYFGKLSGGLGTDKRYSNEAMLNYFKGKKKFSGYGIMSNTGKIGLDWQDRDKFGSGSGWDDGDVVVGAGFIMVTGGADDEFSDYGSNFWGEGVPKTWKAGAHFSNKWNSDVNHVNTNYSIKGISNDASGSSLTKYILPDSSYYFNENHRNISSDRQQLFTGLYDLKLDSLASIKFKLNAAVGHNQSSQYTASGSDDENQQAVNRNVRRNNSEGDRQAYMASLLYRQKFSKKGRTLSLSASHKYVDNQNTGYLLSATSFYDRQGQVYERDSIDQYKESYTRTLSSMVKTVYTEPIGKKSTLEFNYAISRVANASDRKSYDKENGKYTGYNPLYSNDYQLNYLTNSTGLKYQYTSKKVTANFGTDIGFSNYTQKDSMGVETRKYRYTNLFPNARVNWRMAAQRNLSLTYNGRNQPPSIDQIQPIYENTDPLNLRIGNPNLDQAFAQSFTLFYNDFKTLSGRSIWANASYNFTHNDIVLSQVTDSSGKRTSQYINTNGNYSIWYYLSYGIKLKKLDLNVNFNTRGNISRYVSFVNNLKNESTNKSYNLGMGLYKNKQNKYNVYVNAEYGINNSTSSISTQKSDFWTQNYGLGADLYITKRLVVNNNLDADLREKVDAFDQNNNVVTWNASLKYKLFKNKNGEFAFSAYDILNQRKGFSRNFNSNYVVEKTYQVLQRYFMVSFTWNFTHNPTPAPAPGQ